MNNLKDIANEILLENNNQHTWLNIKLLKINRIDTIDKDNNYFVKPNDCRWWYGDTKSKRYTNLCKNVPKGKRKEFQQILEYIHNMRQDFVLFVPEHPINNYKFEKNPIKIGFYNLCNNGIVVKNIVISHENKEECPICYEHLTDKNYYVTACCGKKFCGTCIFKHYAKQAYNLNNTCPLCRQDFVKIPQVPAMPYSNIRSRAPSFDNNIIQRQDTIYNRNDDDFINNMPNLFETEINQHINDLIHNAPVYNTPIYNGPLYNEATTLTVGINDDTTLPHNYFNGTIEQTTDVSGNTTLFERLDPTFRALYYPTGRHNDE